MSEIYVGFVSEVGKEVQGEVVGTLMNNISGWINLDGKNISKGNKLFLVILRKLL